MDKFMKIEYYKYCKLNIESGLVHLSVSNKCYWNEYYRGANLKDITIKIHENGVLEISGTNIDVVFNNDNYYSEINPKKYKLLTSSFIIHYE